jgi:hypothetical protein
MSECACRGWMNDTLFTNLCWSAAFQQDRGLLHLIVSKSTGRKGTSGHEKPDRWLKLPTTSRASPSHRGHRQKKKKKKKSGPLSAETTCTTPTSIYSRKSALTRFQGRKVFYHRLLPGHHMPIIYIIYRFDPFSEVARERLGRHELVSAKGKRTADKDGGVEADARRGAVGSNRGCAGGCVGFGLGVAVLFSR